LAKLVSEINLYGRHLIEIVNDWRGYENKNLLHLHFPFPFPSFPISPFPPYTLTGWGNKAAECGNPGPVYRLKLQKVERNEQNTDN